MRTNWAGNVTFKASGVARPTTIDELREVVAGADRVRAVGTGHSFNLIVDTTGRLVSLADLPQAIDIDPVNQTVTVPAGMRYGELVTRLDAAGFALHNLASLPHITVAGAVATATHGSGVNNGNLATPVCALEMVTGSGALVSLDGEALAGAAVSLGALGIVTKLTFRLAKTFEIMQYVYDDVPREDVNEILSSGYSVSLFTDWRTPRRVNQVWRKCLPGEQNAWTGGTPADGPRHPIPDMDPVTTTQQLGVPGPWHERLTHFRLDHTPSAGDELQSEYFVPLASAEDALSALDPIAERIAAVLQISEIRTVKADNLWLSPAFERDCLAIHFTWVKDPAAVGEVIDLLEERLAPFDPRPHWGKLFHRRPALHEGFVALMDRYDPDGKLRNDFMAAIVQSGETPAPSGMAR
ncbi:FAD-binding protein [Allorhizocola rhizosphaerae]|uniref:FAD-binding protein n=1 Tax=Allorhizocola rhizosphaerae TaxID=1872709 RepID=UPI001B8C765B|nr:FAD-binding protein [Allorhizocola rhizosphaerae]